MSVHRQRPIYPPAHSNAAPFDYDFRGAIALPSNWQQIFIDTPLMLLAVDGDGTMLACTRCLARALGYDSDKLIGASIAGFVPDHEHAHINERLRICLDERREIHRWRTSHLLAEGGVARFDVTAAVSDNGSALPTVVLHYRPDFDLRTEGDAMPRSAEYDALTSLVARSGFQRTLHELLLDRESSPGEHALVLLDLDQFKIVNEIHGHATGDALLHRIAQLLRSLVRPGDRVGRLGGDEFAVLMVDCPGDEATCIAEHLREAIARLRFRWGEHTIRLSASVGLVAITEGTTDAASALRAAESACSIAKAVGRNRTHIHDPHDTRLNQRNLELDWVARIRRALEEGRFCLAAQPIVSLHRPRRGERFAELLLRFIDDDGELVSPGEFMIAAERYNLLTAIDRWVITRAFEWLASSPPESGGPTLCFINISGHSLGDEDFYELVASTARRLKVPGSRVCFEITESAAIADIHDAARLIGDLKEQGYRFALDDVGRGLSSFAYLRDLPVDFVKIDGEFVRDVARDAVALATVRCIHELGRVMGKTTIAEFAESREIVSLLVELGVDYAQGYALGYPEVVAGRTWEAISRGPG